MDAAADAATMIPPGYRFLPTDSELLMYYLWNKAAGACFPPNWPIQEAQLYGDGALEPQQLFSHYGHEQPLEATGKKDKSAAAAADGDLYFFTIISKKFESGKRKSRVAGSGTWKSQKTSEVWYNQELIGHKTILNFEKNECSDSWIMHEYILPGSDQKNQWTVCRIRRGRSNNTSVSSYSAVTNNTVPPPSNGECSHFQSYQSMLYNELPPSSLERTDHNVTGNKGTKESIDESNLGSKKRARTSENNPTTHMASCGDNNFEVPGELDQTISLADLENLMSEPMGDACGTWDEYSVGKGTVTSVPPAMCDDHELHVTSSPSESLSTTVASSSKSIRRRPSLDDPAFKSLFIRKQK